ncbi:Aminomethyltransferase folate-binding domain-containing protein [Nadsonia fulvescens var. elongata DSM 6958]|uniref:Aminomethyltransferase folate-binding domain-containing protein n=1 Tax=Nadsonia fulvescens var. elongata DSM 6958 TaxID=857566 RepID=A0A1E3PGP7_9ASCO|nr:Aminomethyltransferase folate-binding domain-containing protein [Nadsonia fulvescens var. elongata DSM 6958]
MLSSIIRYDFRILVKANSDVLKSKSSPNFRIHRSLRFSSTSANYTTRPSSTSLSSNCGSGAPINLQNSRFFHSNSPTNISTPASGNNEILNRPNYSSTLPEFPPAAGCVELSNRALISIEGPDATKLLNGCFTNSVVDNAVAENNYKSSIFGTFLNSKGKVVCESYLYSYKKDMDATQDVSYFIECDVNVVSDLLKNLKRFTLRAKVKLSQVSSDNYKLWFLWNDLQFDPEVAPSDSFLFRLLSESAQTTAITLDARAPYFGTRVILPASVSSPLDVLAASNSTVDITEFGTSPLVNVLSYNLRRVLFGIPEGLVDIPLGKRISQEVCTDYMGGINYEKGCYVGQELTIRTFHNGVVRKRIVPVALYAADITNPNDAPQGLFYDTQDSISREIDTLSCLPGLNIINLTELQDGLDPSKSKSTVVDNNRFTTSPSPFGASAKPVSRRKSGPKSVGNLATVIGNVGLALVRLDEFGDPDVEYAVEVENPGDGTIRYVKVRGFIPEWWPEEE